MIERLGLRKEQKLYVSARHDGEEFRELKNEYWFPFMGRAAFNESAAAAKEEAIGLWYASNDSASSIPLWSVAIHSKTSYYRFYENLQEMVRRSGATPPEGYGEPPARISFERPALILQEHEAEDPRLRAGAGFTVTSAFVCLPKPLRDKIGAELQARLAERWIVLGFPVARFDLPQSRQITPNSDFKGGLWVFETDGVEIEVF